MASNTAPTSLAAFDGRPFFDKALRYGVAAELITPGRLEILQEDFAKGIVQIANYFGTAHLRPELELAQHRMVRLISLYLEEISGGDLRAAACSLRDKTLLSHSKGGSEMLKRLHAMPESAVIAAESVTPDSQRAYLDEKTLSGNFTLDKYRAELEKRQEIQSAIDFAFWLAKKMGVSRRDVDDADSLIRSAMLVLFVDKAEIRMPSRTSFVHLVKAARAAKAKLDERRLDVFLKNEPEEFQRLTRRAMERFLTRDLPQIRASGTTADKLLYGDYVQSFFVAESVDDDVREYNRLVAREWDRVTRGEADDPAVLATVFLFVATGLPPKASMLLKEAKEIIRVFRNDGFDSQAVEDFVTGKAPEAMREDLLRFWSEDLRREAEEGLADTDPRWPDTHMERALKYLRSSCAVSWKGSRG